MKKISALLPLLFAGIAAFGNIDTPSTDPDNLISREYFKKQLSWVNPARLWICSDKSRPFEVRDEVLIMNSPKGSVSASIPLSIGYETADRFRLTFEYRLQGEGNVCLISRNSVKKRPGGWQQQNLKPTAEWKKIDKILPRIPESETLSISFGLPKKGAKLEVKNLKLTGLEPVKASKIPVVLAGKEAKGIYCSKDDFHAWYSAKLFRSQLWRVMNLVLPLKACSAEELASLKNGIIFTSRAKNAGPGGYELMVTPGKAVIRGNDKLSGLELGAVDLLRRLGIEYYTTHIYSIPDKLQAEPCNICMTPAVPLRFTCWPMEMPELLGYSNPVFADNKRKIGAFYRTYAHTAGYYLPYAEFSKTHPEYYALQTDGKRLRRIPGKRFEEHFCMSNTEAQKILASRMIEYIRTEPLAKFFNLSPGDGGGMYCRCEKCMKMGKNLGERNIAWVNAIAKIVRTEFPDVRISTSAYVDSRFPPETVFPDKNVVIQYCPYGPVWMNHLINDHPDNAQGIADLKEWERKCPGQMAFYDYPVFCREKWHIWPAFYANYGRFKHIAEKKYFYLIFDNLQSTYYGGTVPAPSFANIYLYVFSKVLTDPKTDVEKEIDRFMKFCYGPAAPFMRSYFDLAHKEVRDRNWSQNTERIIRGFVTKSFAAKCYDLFAKAEKAAEGTVYYGRVRERKIHLLWSDLTDNCRGNGKISRAELPQYAEKLAELCRICKQYGKSYNKIPFKKWFWDTAVLHIKGKGAFYNDPMIVKLMNDPLNTLLKATPDVQKKTSYGYYFENAGLMGGERMKTAWLTAKPFSATCLRRPSSGFGVAQFEMKLDQVPQSATLEIFGIDNEKKEPSRMKIEVNGKKIYEGKVPWEKDDWTSQKFPIPAKLLHKGENNIVIFNTTPDTEVDGEGGEHFRAKRNYFWGWFMVRDVKVLVK